MSSLIFPECTYDNLDCLLGGESRRKIAYETVAVRDGGDIHVLHHGNLIATLHDDSLFLTTAGWDSRTTADRLRRIIAANCGSERPIGVCIRDGVTCFRGYGTETLEVFPAGGILIDLSANEYVTL